MNPLCYHSHSNKQTNMELELMPFISPQNSLLLVLLKISPWKNVISLHNLIMSRVSSLKVFTTKVTFYIFLHLSVLTILSLSSILVSPSSTSSSLRLANTEDTRTGTRGISLGKRGTCSLPGICHTYNTTDQIPLR